MPTLYGEVTTVREAVTGWVCNKCGHEVDADDTFEAQELFRYRDVGGFGSVWGDGTDWEVVLCQRCAHEVLAPYATTPDGERITVPTDGVDKEREAHAGQPDTHCGLPDAQIMKETNCG